MKDVVWFFMYIKVNTETISKPERAMKIERNKDSRKIKIRRQIGNGRGELSILSESGLGFDNIQLNIKERNIYQKYKLTNTTEVAQLIEK
jgi:hypothetical protein